MCIIHPTHDIKIRYSPITDVILCKVNLVSLGGDGGWGPGWSSFCSCGFYWAQLGAVPRLVKDGFRFNLGSCEYHVLINPCSTWNQSRIDLDSPRHIRTPRQATQSLSDGKQERISFNYKEAARSCQATVAPTQYFFCSTLFKVFY